MCDTALYSYPFYLPSLLYPFILSHLFSLFVYVHVLYVVHESYTRTVHGACMLGPRRVPSQLKFISSMPLVYAPVCQIDYL